MQRPVGVGHRFELGALVEVAHLHDDAAEIGVIGTTGADQLDELPHVVVVHRPGAHDLADPPGRSGGQLGEVLQHERQVLGVQPLDRMGAEVGPPARHPRRQGVGLPQQPAVGVEQQGRVGDRVDDRGQPAFGAEVADPDELGVLGVDDRQGDGAGRRSQQADGEVTRPGPEVAGPPRGGPGRGPPRAPVGPVRRRDRANGRPTAIGGRPSAGVLGSGHEQAGGHRRGAHDDPVPDLEKGNGHFIDLDRIQSHRRCSSRTSATRVDVLLAASALRRRSTESRPRKEVGWTTRMGRSAYSRRSGH